MNRERKGSASYRRAMRERGYSDGRAGRPEKFADAHYQSSWRRGREAAASSTPAAPFPPADRPWSPAPGRAVGTGGAG